MAQRRFMAGTLARRKIFSQLHSIVLLHYRLERGTIRGSTRLPLGGRAYIPSRDPTRTALAALTCEPSLANLCGVALAAMMKGCRISGLR
jgi:hypothetical protein